MPPSPGAAWGGTASYSFAVGWSGSLPSWNGPCDTATLLPAGILEQPAPGSFVARRPGIAEVHCRDGKLRLDVRQPDLIAIDPLGPMSRREDRVLSAIVADAKGALDLGDAEVQWTLPPQLRQGSRCEHMLGTCLSGASVRIIADAPGDAQVSARYGSLTGTATLHIE